MKNLTILAALFALSVAPAVAAETKSYSLPSFERIHVATGVTLNVNVGPAQSVSAETDNAKDFDRLVIELKGGELMIYRKPDLLGWLGNQPHFTVTVALPALRGLDASSGSRANVQGAVQGNLDVRASSGADAKVSGVDGGNVTVAASSGADAKLVGHCAAVDARVSSGADIDADELKCETASVEASSGGGLAVFASKALSGHASSGGSVTVLGNPPAFTTDESSGGSIRKGTS